VRVQTSGKSPFRQSRHLAGITETETIVPVRP
jgi:hypothetical protein